MPQTKLTLPEQVMVLVLDERDGSLLEETDFVYAIAGAALAELIRQGCVDLEPGSVHPLVTVVDPSETGDPVLDAVLGHLVEATRRTTLQRWVGRLADDRELCLKVARQLCRKGALDEHEGRVRLIFRRTVYADVEPSVEEEVVGRVRNAVFGDDPVDPSTAMLTSLANASGILAHVLDPAQLLAHHDRLASMADRAGGEDGSEGVFGGAAAPLLAATRTAVLQGAATAA
ncbi:MAG: GPP34 family phosphoprotein [Gemmatimonadota bacterium]